MSNVKAGQIYKAFLENDVWTLLVITHADEGLIDTINTVGVTDTILSDELILDSEHRWELIAEYPTWNQAVNSKEFRGDLQCLQ